MNLKNCSKYESCSAPICPMFSGFKEAIWYADEEICQNKELFPDKPVLDSQNKIKRRDRSKETYYTYDMLNRSCIIKGGITGIDPDKDEEPQVNSWLKAHPVPSDDQVKARSERMKKNIEEGLVVPKKPSNKKKKD